MGNFTKGIVHRVPSHSPSTGGEMSTNLLLLIGHSLRRMKRWKQDPDTIPVVRKLMEATHRKQAALGGISPEASDIQLHSPGSGNCWDRKREARARGTWWSQSCPYMTCRGRGLSGLLFYCCEETPWPGYLLKESLCLSAYSSTGLDSMTLMEGSIAAGSQPWCCSSNWGLHLDPQARGTG